MLKNMTEGRLYKGIHDPTPLLSESAESILRAYLVERKVQINYNRDDSMRSFKGYGDGKPAQRNHRGSFSSEKTRVAWNVCIFCIKKIFHSSNFCNAGQQIYKRFAKAYLAGAQSDDDDEDPAPEKLDGDEIFELEM